MYVYVWNIIPVMDNQGYTKMVTVVIQLSFGDNSKQKWLEVKKFGQ